MSIFCVKKITPPIRLGQKLRETRTNLGLDLPTLSLRTHIPEKYLQVIEINHFDELPSARAYRLAYIRACALVLKLDTKKIIRQFIEENGLKNTSTRVTIAPYKNLFQYYSSMRYLIVGIFAFLFVGYMGWQIKGILTPPILNIYSPAEGSVALNGETIIEGQTEKECHLTINGQNIQVNENGKFSGTINLAVGVNTINFSATKKHGKTTAVTRHIIVKETPKIESLSVKAIDPSKKTW